MKRTFIYIAALATLSVASCNVVDFTDNIGSELSFELRSADMPTKAMVAGDDTYNENTITKIDYYFFSDAEGTTVIKQGTASASDLTENGDGSKRLTFDTSVAENANLKKTSYAYFLVNYTPASGTNIHATGITLDDLLGLPVGPTDFEAESLPDFVMDSFEAGIASGNENGLIYLKPVKKNEVRTEKVNLSRVAVKLVLKMNISKQLAGNGDEVWTPVTDQLQAYFVNAINESTVAATPVTRTAVNDGIYFTYDTGHEYVTGAATQTSYVYTTTPFYTYPQSFNLNDNGEPYFKISLPWISSKKGLNPFRYKVLVSDLKEYKRNRFYTVNLNIDAIGGTSEDYVLATSDYYVAEWFTPGEIDQSGLSSARFLDVANDVYSFYGENSMTIPVTSSHDVAINSITATKKNFETDADISVTNFTTSTDGKVSFTISHTLNNDITSSSFDCSPITFTVTLKHTDDGQQKLENVTVIQYPPIYVEKEQSNGYAYVNSYSYSRNHGGRYYYGGSYNNSSNSLGAMNEISESMNNNDAQYTITVSVLPEDYSIEGMNNNIVIGDPRGGVLRYSRLGYTGITGTNEVNVQNKYSAVSPSAMNVVAPQIRIASSWGATSQITSYDIAEERCAGYQENGYPAGRWRVPTLAEIDFLIQLSNHNHIPPLFTTQRLGTRFYRGYWANGPSVYVGDSYLNDNVNPKHTAPYVIVGNDYSATRHQQQDAIMYNDEYFLPGIRCVYDEWYWGSEKDTAHMTTWGGYQMD